VSPESVISSPFDALFIEFEDRFHRALLSSGPNVECLGFLTQQYGLLRAAYVVLLGSGSSANRFVAAAQLGTGRPPYDRRAMSDLSKTAFLGYESLIKTLCQLDRALPVHIPGAAATIPLSNRIRLYRNKVAEHWDEYTRNISKGSFTFGRDKAPIPIVEGSVRGDDRQDLLCQLKAAFKQIGVELRWPIERFHIGVSKEADYCETIYAALESVGDELSLRGPKYTALMTLLMKFGFPVAIRDVEGYAEHLNAHLRCMV
jgi:hypothetical protein